MTEQPDELSPDYGQVEGPGDKERVELSTDELTAYLSLEVEDESPALERVESTELSIDQHIEPVTQVALDHTAPLPKLPPPHRKNGRIWLIMTGCLLALFACCCRTTLFMYFIGGDWLLHQLGYLP